MILKHYHLILILIAFIVKIKMENVEEDDYDNDYDYDSKEDVKVNLKYDSKDRQQIDNKNEDRYDKIQNDNVDSVDKTDRTENEKIDKNDKIEDKIEDKTDEVDKEDKVIEYKDEYFRNGDEERSRTKYSDEKINDKYDEISRYQNIKYDNNKNYKVAPDNYELIEEDYDIKDESRDVNDDLDSKNFKLNSNKYETNDDSYTPLKDTFFEEKSPKDTSLKDSQPKELVKIKLNSRSSKPKTRKSQAKLIKEIKYPKSAFSRPKYYYPGRNFVHQRQSKNRDKKLSKIKLKSNKIVNNDQTTLIPLEFYKHQIKSRFVANNKFSDNNGHSSRLEEFEVPQILNGELYCDCGFYLKLKNKKISKLSSKLKKVSNEQKQMKRKLIEMAIKENQLQLICRSQSKANLKYINNGKPGYLALSNATSQSNPIDLI